MLYQAPYARASPHPVATNVELRQAVELPEQSLTALLQVIVKVGLRISLAHARQSATGRIGHVVGPFRIARASAAMGLVQARVRQCRLQLTAVPTGQESD